MTRATGMTLEELERALKEARLRGAQDHTPVRVVDRYGDRTTSNVKAVTFSGTIKIK